MSPSGPGRPRSPDIDGRVLDVTRHLLAEHGYEAMSLVAVAEQAGTTRQAIYRRWSTKADLAAAAIADVARPARPSGDDPFADLVGELRDFRRGIDRRDGVAMVGTMLVGSTDPALLQAYRERVVRPRRARLRRILEEGQAAGLLDEDGDIDLALTMLTGSWYARELAGDKPPTRWAERAASIVWRGMGGGRPPAAAG